MFACLVGNGDGCGIVDLYWCGRLRVAKFFKNGANGDGGFAVVEEGADFGFSRGRHDIFEDVGDG